MKRWLKNLDTSIRQSLSDFCERRSQAAKSIRAEMFWDKLGWWVLNA
jgi:hypothetical protein